MKIAHISDSHFDERRRLEDTLSAHMCAVKQMAEAGVDLILHTGDLAERKTSPKERLAICEFLQAACEVAPVVIIKGNHDAQLDLLIWHELSEGRAWPITVLEQPVGHAGPESAVLPTPCQQLALLALPWMDKSHYQARLDVAVDAASAKDAAQQAAELLLMGLQATTAEAKAKGMEVILAGHLNVLGASVASGQVPQGTTVDLTPQQLQAVGADYVALGHIHKAQAWAGVTYAGSPVRQDFGEPEEKGWVLVEILADATVCSFKEIPGPEMVKEELDLTEEHEHLQETIEAWISGQAFWNRGMPPLVQLKIHLHADDMSMVSRAKVEAALTEYCSQVSVELIPHHTTAIRSAAILKAQSLQDKLAAYLQSKELEPSEKEWERLTTKLSTLEGEGHATAAE